MIILLINIDFVNNSYYLKYLEKQNIRDGLFGELTTQIQDGNDLIDFTFAPFWVDVNRWLMAMLLIAMILLGINCINSLTARQNTATMISAEPHRVKGITRPKDFFIRMEIADVIEI